MIWSGYVRFWLRSVKKMVGICLDLVEICLDFIEIRRDLVGIPSKLCGCRDLSGNVRKINGCLILFIQATLSSAKKKALLISYFKKGQ